MTFGSDKRFRLVNTNVGGDNHVMTFGTDKRFGLVDTNVTNANHVITFGSDRRFGLVDMQRTDLEGNTAVRGKWEVRGHCNHH
jgi:hypothetical protein